MLIAAQIEETPEVKEIQPVVDALKKAVADFQISIIR